MHSSINEYFVELAKKWAKILSESHVYHVDPDVHKPKFFVTAAFMYPNGPIHIGHGRTYLIADVLARFKRIMGYNVLFPMGFHYTGTPIIAMAEAVAEKDRDLINLFTSVYRVPEEEIEKMCDPLYMAKYFHNVSKEVMKLYGLSIDWRREFTTVDPEFRTFIHWQFENLYEKGYIEKGTHPVGWCPKHAMPVGMHDTKGDVEPEIGEFVAIFFRDAEGTIYPTATLRPETIFGVTNIWVNPSARYAIIRLSDGSKWIVGAKAAERLRHQLDFDIVDQIDGIELVGRRVVNPITGEKVPILPARFVDASFATGIVMSVPAHAPYDAIALEELKSDRNYVNIVDNITPRIIIEVNGSPKANAYEALKKFGIVAQEEKEKLDNATKYVYSLELRSGYMINGLSNTVPMATDNIKSFVKENVDSKGVEIARENIKKFMIEQKFATIIYEILNKPVYCRCETEVVVKLLKDQWFIDYGNSGWKELAKKALTKMVIVPEEARPQFEATIDWLKKRACARTRGLGVPLPWDDRWIIESLSDSTIYMAFYTVIHKIRRYGIPPEKLVKEFWDYIMLGKGNAHVLSEKLSIPAEVLDDIRREFAYWYPLDFRISGKDLIPNHLTFFIFNHVAIFPEDLHPKGIAVNGWVLVRQQKMSKSLRNIIPLKNIIEEYGSDVVRLLIALGSEVHQDENIDADILDKLCRHEYPQMLMWIHDIAVRLFESKALLRSDVTNIDRLIWNEFLYKVSRAVKLLDGAKIREAGIIIFYDIKSLVNKYLELVEVPNKMVLDMLRIWIPMISIYTPFIAEEIWSKTFSDGYASLQKVPLPNEIDEKALMALRYAELIIEAVSNIAKATKKAEINSIVLYVAPREHQEIMKKVLTFTKQGLKLSEIVNLLANELGLSKRDVAHIAKSMYDVAISIPEDLAGLYVRLDGIDEMEILDLALEYLTRMLKAKVEVYRADDPRAPDKGGKKKASLPLKPGIYVE